MIFLYTVEWKAKRIDGAWWGGQREVVGETPEQAVAALDYLRTMDPKPLEYHAEVVRVDGPLKHHLDRPTSRKVR